MGTVVLIIATYSFARAELHRAFDGELQQIARAVDLREDWAQAGRVRIAKEGVVFAVRAYDASGRIFFETASPSIPQGVQKVLEPGFSYAETEAGR